MDDKKSLRFALAVVSVGFISRVAINASPFLLPLMFQIGFGFSPQYAGVMVLVYMASNLAMSTGIAFAAAGSWRLEHNAGAAITSRRT